MARTRNAKSKFEVLTLSDAAIALLGDLRAALSAPLVLEPSPRDWLYGEPSLECGAVYRGYGARDAAMGELVMWGFAAQCPGIGGMYAITREGLEWDGNPHRAFAI